MKEPRRTPRARAHPSSLPPWRGVPPSVLLQRTRTHSRTSPSLMKRVGKNVQCYLSLSLSARMAPPPKEEAAPRGAQCPLVRWLSPLRFSRAMLSLSLSLSLSAQPSRAKGCITTSPQTLRPNGGLWVGDVVCCLLHQGDQPRVRDSISPTPLSTQYETSRMGRWGGGGRNVHD